MEYHIRMVLSLWALCLLSAGCSNESPPPVSQPSAQPPTLSLADQLADNSFSSSDPDEHYIPVLGAGDNVRLGARFDTLTGNIIASAPCIAGYEEVSRGNANSQMRLVEVSDSQTMMRAMNIDASVQGGFLKASGGVKASFVNEQKYTQQTQHFLLYALANRTPRTLDPQQGHSLFDLTPEARAALDSNDRNAFRKLCGDGFVFSIYEGVELYGMLQFNSVSQEQKQKISTSMHGSYGGWEASGDASTAVDNYSKNNQTNLSVELNGQCSAVNTSGDDMKTRWNNLVGSGSALLDCAKEGGNMVSYKVLPYSSRLIKDWPDQQQEDPEFSLILNYYARYGTILDSINQLLTARPQAYQLALLGRGMDFAGLEQLGNEIRSKRLALVDLLDACQRNADPNSRNAICSTNQAMLNSLAGYPDPYIYWARLPLFFATDQPREAFLSEPELSQRLINQIQQQKDSACAQADRYGYHRDPACPADFPSLLEKAKREIKLAPYSWPRNQGYVFITQSTSTNRCMVAPGKKVAIVTTATCEKPYAKHQQRFLWRDSYQLFLRKGSKADECLAGRELATCDSKQPSQLWRFVPSLKDPKLGLLQSAENRCLHHANVDRNVTYKGCTPNALEDDNFLWRAMAGQ